MIIFQDLIIAKNKKYHFACFKCNVCKSNLIKWAFFEHNSKIYCPTDYYQLVPPACQRCKSKITGEVRKIIISCKIPGIRAWMHR